MFVSTYTRVTHRALCHVLVQAKLLTEAQRSTNPAIANALVAVNAIEDSNSAPIKTKVKIEPVRCTVLQSFGAADSSFDDLMVVSNRPHLLH
jgi:hypothetical protein